MRFPSNFRCTIIFLRFVKFSYQQHSKSLFKGSIGHVTCWRKWPIVFEDGFEFRFRLSFKNGFELRFS